MPADSPADGAAERRPRITPPPLRPDPASVPAGSASNWNLANGLTMARILLVPVFAVLLLDGAGNRVAACVVFAIASLTDRIDGEIARKRGLVTEFGKFADPLADKALMGTALVGLSVIGVLAWWVTVVILVREVGVTLLRLWVIRHGVLPASRGGKVKTTLQAVAIGLFVLPLTGAVRTAAEAVMWVALMLTVVTGLDYVFRAMSLRRRSLARSAARSESSA